MALLRKVHPKTQPIIVYTTGSSMRSILNMTVVVSLCCMGIISRRIHHSNPKLCSNGNNDRVAICFRLPPRSRILTYEIDCDHHHAGGYLQSCSFGLYHALCQAIWSSRPRPGTNHQHADSNDLICFVGIPRTTLVSPLVKANGTEVDDFLSLFAD